VTRGGFILGAALLLSAASVGEARSKPSLLEGIPGVKAPDIEELLTKAGWTLTPEMSAAYSQPGDIFGADNALLKKGSSCFEAPVHEGAYASMEVTQSMAAGVRMRINVVGVRAGMGIEKKIIFDTPVYRQIPQLDLIPTAACLQSLRAAQASGRDTSGWYVITESLSAIIQKQECGSYNAKAGTFVLSGDVEVQQACARTSLEPVAVAYKTRPVSELLAAAPAPALSPTLNISSAPARTSVDFGVGGSGVGVAKMLREQRCDEAAKRDGAAAREIRMNQAAQSSQEKATAAWTKIKAQIEGCTELPREKRDPCIGSVDIWLSKARAMTIQVAEGVEAIETDCGPRQPAFPAQQRTVEAAGVRDAEVLLARLQAPTRSTAGASLDLSAEDSALWNDAGREFCGCITRQVTTQAVALRCLMVTLANHKILISSYKKASKGDFIRGLVDRGGCTAVDLPDLQ
jgi:hypothetical protein